MFHHSNQQLNRGPIIMLARTLQPYRLTFMLIVDTSTSTRGKTEIALKALRLAFKAHSSSEPPE